MKIWITPAEASVPYRVAAAAPLRISMWSIASGLMSSSRDGVPPPPAPSQLGSPNPPLRFTRTPSTYTTGSFACVRLAEPRIRICAPSPARPPVGSTDTAGSRAASCSETFETGALRNVDASIVETVFPSLRFSVSAPAPVTTTTSSAIAAGRSSKSASAI